MRLAIGTRSPIEWIMLRLGFIPEPLVLGFWGMSASRTIMTATELGVFDALESGPLSAEQVARHLSCDPFGTEVLLNALSGFGYVRRRRGTYANTRRAQRWLTRSSRFSMTDTVLFYDDLWDTLGEMTELVRSGETRNMHYQGRGAEFWQHYLRGLAAFAKLAGPLIAKRVRVPSGPRRLLDVGGGHGLYAAAFAQRNPNLTAEVLDLPEACAQGRALVAEAGLSERVAFREADARTADWGSGFDVVLLFNLLHNLEPAECSDALARARDALAPGGTVVVLEAEHRATDGDLSTTAGMDELLFYLTSGTRVYPEPEMRRWLSEAGFSAVRTRRLTMLPLVLITGTR